MEHKKYKVETVFEWIEVIAISLWYLMLGGALLNILYWLSYCGVIAMSLLSDWLLDILAEPSFWYRDLFNII